MGGARHADIRTCQDGVSNAHVWSKREIKMDEARRAREQARNDMTSPQTLGCHRQGQGGGRAPGSRAGEAQAAHRGGVCAGSRQARHTASACSKPHCAMQGPAARQLQQPAQPVPSHPIPSNPIQISGATDVVPGHQCKAVRQGQADEARAHVRGMLPSQAEREDGVRPVTLVSMLGASGGWMDEWMASLPTLSSHGWCDEKSELPCPDRGGVGGQ